MAIGASIIVGDIMHKRLRPRVHAFRYRVYYLCFALSHTAELCNRFLSLDRWNLFSFHKRDHGARDGSDPEQWIRGILATYGVTQADGDIVLLTLPRILGYVFNPVSFWFCLDRAGQCRAVLSEVSNTFGEHHSYISYHDDYRPIAGNDWLRAEKVFHVSPFMDVQGYYLSRFVCTPDKVSAQVNYFDDQGMILATSVSGKPMPLTATRLLKYFFLYPLVTFKVIGLIHWEALRIFLKGVRYRLKPLPPMQKVTR